MKQFLYSDHEIFLRELVANAVDASQKMKAIASNGDFKGELGELRVRVELDEKAKTLRIIDSGIGMTDKILLAVLGVTAVALAAAVIALRRKSSKRNKSRKTKSWMD